MKYENEPLFGTGGRWTLQCSGLQAKKKKRIVEHKIRRKFTKNDVNFTRLFSVVYHQHQIRYLLFEWNFTDG